MKTNIKKIAYLLVLLAWPGILQAQNSSQNYVVSRTFYTDTESKYNDEVQYYDGLGRPFQNIQKRATPSGNNLITLQEYDAHGRPANAWLPTVSTNNYLSPTTIKSQAPGNYANDSRPYNSPVYESSPLKRITAEYGAGSAWSNKPITNTFNTNTANGDYRCTLYKVSTAYVLTKEGNYPTGQLFITSTADEDQHILYTFTDKEGRTVLSRQMAGTEPHDTYYVYDDYGNLCYVLPPMIGDDISATNLHQYAYSYKYDHRNNCIEKKLPGGTIIKYVYDQADKLIFSQDGVQAAKSPQEWSFYLYDKYKRPTVQGICTNTNTSTIANSTVTCSFTLSNTGIGASGYTANYTLVSPQVHTLNYYDNYRFRSLTGFNDSNLRADTVNAQGLLTGSASFILDTSTKLCSIMYYDDKGRLVKNLSNSHLPGGFEKTTTTYDFVGKPLSVQHIHQATGKSTQTQLYTYAYNDPVERLTKVTHKLNNSSQVTLVDNSYDNFGRLYQKKMHGSTSNQLTYAYNIRNWLTGIASNYFTQNLYYNTGYGAAQYNGNISSVTWKAGTESTLRGYKFSYDGLNRLTQAVYGEGSTISTNVDRFTEKVTGYDKHGNITGLQRYGKTSGSSYGLIDNLAFGYTGNQIKFVNDAVTTNPVGQTFHFVNGSNSTGNEYTYDANGNMTTDSNKNITGIQYNFLNLPKAVQLSGSRSATYLYDGAGIKHKVTHQGGGVSKTTDYCGNVIYENGPLSKILTEEGYITLSGTTPTYHYYLKDHLGNNRVVLHQNGSTIEQVNHYYPFGGVFDQTAEDVQRYKFGGKELDRTYGLDLYDYSARYMDGALGRFTTMDPMAEKYYGISPYAYCKNNPMRFVDPTGMEPEDDPEKNRPKGLKEYVDLFFGYVLYQTGFHPTQMNSGDQAVVEDADRRRGNTIETLHSVNEVMLSFVPGGEIIYKTLNDREISNSEYAWAVVEFIPIGKSGKTTAKGTSIWTKTNKLSAVENALEHWNKHGREFSEFQNAKQYVEGTKDFLHNSPSGTLVKVRPNGDVLKYYPKTNTFGVMDAAGVPRTMFRPTDGMKYWLKQ